MKKLLFSIILISILTTLNAQEEKERVKELGFTFYNLDGFGLTYRIGNQNAVWRFNSVLLRSSEVVGGNSISNINTGFGINAGREWRKTLAKKLAFRYGVDGFFNFDRNTSDNFLTEHLDNESLTYSGGINFVIGFNYEIREALFIGVELLPYLSLGESTNKFYRSNSDDFGNTYYTKNENTSSSTSVGVQNNSALISFIYKY